jgi:uncharacterized protein YcbK (DUF882 family)
VVFPSVPVLALLLSLVEGGAAPQQAPKAPAAIKPPAATKTAAPRPPIGKRPTIPARKTVIRQVGKKKPARPKVIELFHVNSKETLKLRFVDDRGRPVRDMQKRANRFFRCHHTGTTGRMNPRLLRLLFEVGRHWPGQRLEVVSGYRHPTVAKNPRSPHMKGLASDFRVVGVKNTDLRDYLRRAFPKTGVGYYPNSSFVHLDVRQGASAFWIDYSGPGENALYSDNASEDLKSGRADTFRPMKIDPSWAEREDVPADNPDGGASAAPASAAAGQVPATVVPQVQ